MLSSFQMLVNVAVFHLLTQACILEILCNWQQHRLEERLKQMLQYWGPLTLCEVFKSSDPKFKPHSDHKPGLFLVALRSTHLPVPVLKSIGLLPSS